MGTAQDYQCSTIPQALTLAKRVGKAFQTATGKSTESAVKALREALHVGLVADSSRGAAKVTGAISKAEYAALFDVAPAMVSRWGTLVAAVEAGVVFGDDTWVALMSGRNFQRGDVADACKAPDATPDSIRAACEAERPDKATPRKTAAEKAAEKAAKEKADSKAEPVDLTDPDTAETVLRGLLKGGGMLDQAFKSLPIGSDAEATFIRALSRISKREQTLRSLDASGKPVEASKAA